MKLGIAVAVTSCVSLAAGSAAGFFFAKSRLSTHYAELAEREIAEARAFYSKRHKKEEFASPEAAAEALLPEEAKEALKTYQDADKPKVPTIVAYHKVAQEPTESPVKMSNVFKQAEEPDVEWEIRVRNRTEEAPYVITNEEFFEGELEYKQATLTYYEGDGVLTDERDDVIDEVDLAVGDDNIIRFGDHSADPNIVYVRNDRLSIDFEVTRSRGKYSVEVAGLQEA